jgi:hypothetical protein
MNLRNILNSPIKNISFREVYYNFLFAFIALILLSITSTSNIKAELLFQDDFSSGDSSKHNEFFRWGRDGSFNQTGANSSMIEDITGPDGNTVKALTFTFGRWQEIRFHLTKSIDEQRTDQNISDTYYKEVWLSYDIFIPSNYYHRGSGEGVEAGNNKGFFYLWHGPYESSQTQTSTSLQWWPSSSYHRSEEGISIQSLQTWGHTFVPDYVSPSHASPGEGSYPDRFSKAFIPQDYGKWINYAFRIYAGTVAGANDGVVEIYKNNKLIMQFLNYNSVREAVGRPLGYDKGYLLGYANTGFDEETILRMTNFKFGTSSEGILSPTTNSALPPSNFTGELSNQ